MPPAPFSQPSNPPSTARGWSGLACPHGSQQDPKSPSLLPPKQAELGCKGCKIAGHFYGCLSSQMPGEVANKDISPQTSAPVSTGCGHLPKKTFLILQ